MISVNLIPMPRRRLRVYRARRRAWAVAAISYAATLIVAYAGWRAAWSGDDVDRSRQLTLLRGDIEGAEKSASRTRAALNEASLELRANQAVTLQPDWSVLLALIARLRGDDVVLDRCGVDAGARPAPVPGQRPGEPTPSVLRLAGHGRTQAAVSQFVLGLERTGLFETVAILKANREAFLTGEAMSFKLECQLRAGPAEAAPVKPKPARASPAGLADLGGMGTP